MYLLSRKFRQLRDASELKDYLDEHYSVAAQYNQPPIYPVTTLCGGIDGAPKGSHILDQIHAGIVAFAGKRPCYNTNTTPSETGLGWRWQVSYDHTNLFKSLSYIYCDSIKI